MRVVIGKVGRRPEKKGEGRGWRTERVQTPAQGCEFWEHWATQARKKQGNYCGGSNKRQTTTQQQIEKKPKTKRKCFTPSDGKCERGGAGELPGEGRSGDTLGGKTKRNKRENRVTILGTSRPWVLEGQR